MKRYLQPICILLVVLIMLTGCSKESTIEERVSKAIDETAILLEQELLEFLDTEYAKEDPYAGCWSVMSLARSGRNIDPRVFELYYDNLVSFLKKNNGIINKRKYTEYSRVILALTAMGKDPTDVGGYNLLERMAEFDNVIFQGINGPTFALIALDSNSYEIPVIYDENKQGTRQGYIDNILEKQLDNGGFEFSAKDKTFPADPDMTAMVLQALSAYKEDPVVSIAIDRAVDELANIQLDTGGYASWGVKNSESAVQVLMALTMLGIDPDVPPFTEGDKNLVENILSYYVEGGGFLHVKPEDVKEGVEYDDGPNGIATDQGFYAIINYERWLQGKTPYYVMEDAIEMMNKLK